MTIATLVSLVVMLGAVEARAQDFTPVTDAMLADPDPADWLSWRRTLDGQGYSPLDQINRDNVGELRLAWSWGMEPGVNATTPIVYDGVMYLVNPGWVVQALDARNGDLIWEYRPPAGGGGFGQMRSLAIYEDLLIVNASGPRIFALDVRTGELRWETPVGPQDAGFGFTNGPIVANGVVVAGLTNCGRFQEEPCSLFGVDARTGRVLWRTPTVAMPGEHGDETWGGLPPMYRAGVEAWMTGSFDPETGLVYWGTAQAKPWSRAGRRTFGETELYAGGERELYANSTLALDPKTGEIVWYFQHIPGESHDMDEAFERILIDWNGRKSMFSMGKLGILWELDRETGEFIRAVDLGYQNLVNVNFETGEVSYRSGMIQELDKPFYQCPSFAGVRGLRSMAYHPDVEALYIPVALSCQTSSFPEVEWREGGGGSGPVYDRTNHFHPDSPEHLGQFLALDLKTGKPLWSVKRRSVPHTAALTTGGGLVFFGDLERYFFAYDAETGEELWRTRLSTATNGFPITYAVDGKQYIAVMAGQAGLGISWSTIIPSTLTPEIRNPRAGNAVYVFTL